MMPHTCRRGSILITAVLILELLTVVAATVLIVAINEYTLAKHTLAVTEGLYIAEGSVEWACYELGVYVANNFGDPPDSPLSGSISGTVTLNPAYTAVYSCISNGPEYTFTDTDGIVTYSKNFLIESNVTNSDGIAVQVHQVIARKKTYAFQHAVFYADDLELIPGQLMTFSGRIHSNHDIYLASNGSTLTVDSAYLYATGQIFNQRKDNLTTPNGVVSVLVNGTSSYAAFLEPGDFSPLDCRRADWTAASQTRWGGTVKSGVHGVTARAAPVVGSISPSGYYAQNAGVYIENGTLYAGGAPGQGGVALVEGVDMPAGTVTTTTSFYNNREGRYIRMTEIDMKKLAGYADGDPDGSPSFQNRLPANGLLYATRTDGTTVQQPGVRLRRGSKVESSVGLTVVSNLPVYIQGDYNKNDPSNGYVKKPCAVICDAANVLSNAWVNDAMSIQNVNNRDASNTQINTAFISGVDTTSLGNYNGGLENYPRLHEDWGGRTLQIRGSFVELWNSQVAQGDWVYGSPQYTAPIRNWNYDTDFNNSGNLPPFTPFAVETERRSWWSD